MTNDDLLRALRKRALEAIRGVIPSGPVALLDFPDYANPGDSAIWLGALHSLASLGFDPPAYTCDSRTFDERALRQALPAGTILLTGGGNLGDLWPRHQAFREHVVARFHDYPIVQLPQSIHFTDASALTRARTVLASHPNCTLMVRDDDSNTAARDGLGCRAVLCPDLAFCLLDSEPALLAGTAASPAREELWLLRTDHESDVENNGVPAIDWVDEPGTWWIGRIARLLSDEVARGAARRRKSALHRTASRVLTRSYPVQARAHLRRACRLLRSARVVITDRLHGHILALLCGIPHVVLGDRHGKVRGFVDTWTVNSPLVRRADSPAAAAALARDLRASTVPGET